MVWGNMFEKLPKLHSINALRPEVRQVSRKVSLTMFQKKKVWSAVDFVFKRFIYLFRTTLTTASAMPVQSQHMFKWSNWYINLTLIKNLNGKSKAASFTNRIRRKAWNIIVKKIPTFYGVFQTWSTWGWQNNKNCDAKPFPGHPRLQSFHFF